VAAGILALAAVLAFVMLKVVPGLVSSASPAAEGAESGGPATRYLSEMTPFETENWIKGPPLPPDDEQERRPPPPPITWVSVQGRLSPHGIFMHPPLSPEGGTSRLRYRLDGQYTRFDAEVSMNDGPPEPADMPVTFAVYGDGRLLWKSREVRDQEDAQACTVPVEGVEVLTIEVTCPGDPRNAHAVWIEPRVGS
jgi:hypothetical protein